MCLFSKHRYKLHWEEFCQYHLDHTNPLHIYRQDIVRVQKLQQPVPVYLE